MSRFNSLTPIAAALALSMVGSAQAEVVSSKAVAAGVTVNAAQGMKEGKCGEGKCGKKGVEMGVKNGMDNGLKTGLNNRAMKEGKCGKKRAASTLMKEGKCGEGKCGKKLEGAAVQVDAKAAVALDNANLKAATSLNKANADVQQGASQMEAVKGAAGIQR